jgi:hypothetical protein
MTAPDIWIEWPPAVDEPPAPTIRADLIGSSTCTAAGITAHGAAPVLALCRRLLEAGFDPDQPLEAYRGTTLALRIRAIGEAARLTVKTAGNGAPIFAKDATWKGAGASPARKCSPPLSEGRPATTSGGGR